MAHGQTPPRRVSRRTLLAGAIGVGGVAAAGVPLLALRPWSDTGPGRVLASDEAVRRAERARRDRGTGATVRATLTAEPGEIDLGGRVVPTWAYNGQVPGPVIRCRVGDQLEVDVDNRLPEPTSVHWHGLGVRNDMDGVPHLTQQPIPGGQRMRYTFTVPDPGTYWLHPHHGLQLERGLYAPLIIDDPRETGGYDVEFVVVLDDWMDGVGATPDQILATLRAGDHQARYRIPVQAGKIPDQSGSWLYPVPAALTQPPPGATSDSPASRLAGHVDYPFYLLNGRLPTAPATFTAKPRQRARIRLINAAGTTVFRVALADHRLTVTHTDGYPVDPVTVDTLQIASGERYDLLVTLNDGVFPLVAVAEGKAAQALGVIRTATGPIPPPTAAPTQLGGRLLALTDLHATPRVQLPEREPDTSHTLYLTGNMDTFGWRINGEIFDHDRPFDSVTPLPLYEGDTVRLTIVNPTPMYHPMHLHGHTLALRGYGDDANTTHTPLPAGTRKDTVLVAPGQHITADFTATNPGQWLIHCHDTYHMATGMAALLSYQNRP